jgi:hypothetical protein
MAEAGSLDHGRAVAREYCERALQVEATSLPPRSAGDDRRFLREMIEYVIDRVN